jgi:hypothetical protein
VGPVGNRRPIVNRLIGEQLANGDGVFNGALEIEVTFRDLPDHLCPLRLPSGRAAVSLWSWRNRYSVAADWGTNPLVSIISIPASALIGTEAHRSNYGEIDLPSPRWAGPKAGKMTCGTASWAAGTVNGTSTVHSFSSDGATCAATPCTLDANIAEAGGVAQYVVIRIKRTL